MVMPKPLHTAAAALLTLTPQLAAQTFDARVGFRNNHDNVGVPEAGPWTSITNPVWLGVLFGGFDAQGFTNRGVARFTGTVTLDDPINATLIQIPNNAYRTPFVPGTPIIPGPGTTEFAFDAERNGPVVTWNFGEAPPAETFSFAADEGGPDTYFPGLRLYVTELLPQGTVRDITITVTGQMQAVSGWNVLVSNPPVDESTPGFQFLEPAGLITDEVSATLVITIPAPAATPVLALAGAVAVRRRRRA